MKVVFLDIDGVLNSQAYRKKTGGHAGSSRRVQFLDPEAIARLNRITKQTDAKIVVSSSWRLGYRHDVPGLEQMLHSHGVEAPVIDITPVHPTSFRGAEIQEWLNEHPDVETFVIIDDSSDMGTLLKNLVRTSLEDGLLDQHILPAILKLVSG